MKSPHLIYIGTLPYYAPSKNCAANNRSFAGTPEWLVEMCRKAMGSIDLDPASCFEANEAVIKATRFYSEADDGLQQPWVCETLFMNPPWNRQGSISALPPWLDKLLQALASGNVKQATVVANTSTDSEPHQKLMKNADAFALLCGRVRFIPPLDRDWSSNPYGQVVYYFGPHWRRFKGIFNKNHTVLRYRDD